MQFLETGSTSCTDPKWIVFKSVQIRVHPEVCSATDVSHSPGFVSALQ